MFRPRLLVLILFLSLSLSLSSPARAQNSDYAYWQYDTAGRLNFTAVADVDKDGTDEFLLAVENNTAVLLDSDGRKRWSYPAGETILQLAALDFAGPEEAAGVVVATGNQLALLDGSGELLWQRPIEAPAGAPPAPVVLLTGEDEAAWQSQRAALPLAIAPLDRDGDGRQEIAVALQSGLLQLFDGLGQLLWQYPPGATFPDDARPHIQIGDLNPEILGDEIVYAYYEPGRGEQIAQTKLALLQGDGTRQYERSVSGRVTALTLIQFSQDGQPLIAIGTSLGRRSRLFLYDATGLLQWERSPNKEITDLVQGGPATQPALMVGTEVGTLIAYDRFGRRLWDRVYSFSGVPDRTILDLSAAQMNDFADSSQAEIANPRSEINIAVTLAAYGAARAEATDILLLNESGCIVRSTPSAQSLPAGRGCLTHSTLYPPVPAVGMAMLLDVNRDRRQELLLGRFGTVELIDPGVGVPRYTLSESWSGYRLEARPQVMLTADANGDGERELLIGAGDGSLHVLRRNGVALWREDLGGAVTHLAVADNRATPTNPTVVAASLSDEASGLPNRLHLLTAAGQAVWPAPVLFQTAITDMAVTNLDSSASAEIIVSTADNQLFVYNLAGTELHRLSLPSRVTQLAGLPAAQDDALRSQGSPRPLRDRPSQLYIATAGSGIFRLQLAQDGAAGASGATGEEPDSGAATLGSGNPGVTGTGSILHTFAATPVAPDSIIAIPDNGANEAQVLVVESNGQVSSLDWRGRLLWHRSILPSTGSDASGAEAGMEAAGQSERYAQVVLLDGFLLVATADGRLAALDLLSADPRSQSLEGIGLGSTQSDVSLAEVASLPALSGLGSVTTILRGRLDRDILPDLAIGNSEGEVLLFGGDGRTLGKVTLTAGIFGITELGRQGQQTTELVVVADNAYVQAFSAREDRPPLLVNPTASAGRGSYEIGISVLDIENSDVTISLQTWDPVAGDWRSQGEQIARGGRGTLNWSGIDVANVDGPLRYRLLYNDGSYEAATREIIGPDPVAATGSLGQVGTSLAIVILLLSSAGLVLIRQTRSNDFRARRLYRRLQQQPGATLNLIEGAYRQTSGSPDYLLSLANHARRDGNRPVAGLADGLFLLADRPEAALPIIQSALDEAGSWREREGWQQIFRVSQRLIEAPSITELTLLRPQLLEMIDQRAAANAPLDWAPALLAILNCLRDSERVDLAEDRFVYLNEAGMLIRQLREQSALQTPAIDARLVKAIVLRWQGLVHAAIEELRGQAQLIIQLKTKQVAPGDEATIALVVRNAGRAAAENISIKLVADPAYAVLDGAQTIPVLPPGRTREVHLVIRPGVEERFRLAARVTYEDRGQHRRTLDFADMVYLLALACEFTPVVNPYSPGVPLRRHSNLFFGREELFDFIAQNAAQQTRQNVLVLIGQRRTGKTSALLRLEQHLPAYLVPVYVDCQSLGVLPGMPAFFHDLAWLISDTLATRGIELGVPEVDAWQDDPARGFLRQFVPAAQAALQASLLLIFDEFEALENLVDDGILPPTLFTFLRHMMQHGDGLGFIFVGTRHLKAMTSDYWSVLFNMALHRPIGFLDSRAATRLIRDPVAPHILYDDLAVDKILRVTAGHPYFLQLVCYTLVNRANQERNGYITISDVNAALEEMLRLGEVHFAYLWQRSTKTERALLTAVAHAIEPDTPFRPADLVQYLIAYGIHLDPAEVTAGLNSLVEREILRERAEDGFTLYELNIGLVGLWVAQNKSLSKLYEGVGNREPGVGNRVGSAPTPALQPFYSTPSSSS